MSGGFGVRFPVGDDAASSQKDTAACLYNRTQKVGLFTTRTDLGKRKEKGEIERLVPCVNRLQTGRLPAYRKIITLERKKKKIQSGQRHYTIVYLRRKWGKKTNIHMYVYTRIIYI